MRVSFVLAALAAVASASSIIKRQYPSCAMPCLASADFGTCGSGDTACLCKSESFINSTTTCITGACKGSDLDQALTVSRGACAAAGVTLTNTLPASATGSATATSASGSAASSATPTSSSNGAISFSGSPMVGALAAVAGVVFAL